MAKPRCAEHRKSPHHELGQTPASQIDQVNRVISELQGNATAAAHGKQINDHDES